MPNIKEKKVVTEIENLCYLMTVAKADLTHCLSIKDLDSEKDVILESAKNITRVANKMKKFAAKKVTPNCS